MHSHNTEFFIKYIKIFDEMSARHGIQSEAP